MFGPTARPVKEFRDLYAPKRGLAVLAPDDPEEVPEGRVVLLVGGLLRPWCLGAAQLFVGPFCRIEGALLVSPLFWSSSHCFPL